MKTGENSSNSFRDYTILYMNIALGQWQITPWGQNFYCNKRNFTTLIILCKFQPLVFNLTLKATAIAEIISAAFH